jgi:hypothetical protein
MDSGGRGDGKRETEGRVIGVLGESGAKGDGGIGDWKEMKRGNERGGKSITAGSP